ncbi:hypothetical protein AZF69_23695 [Salmonella enterica]|nr:hypothetical protein [Salmonella enterica]EBQ1580827.1 hypothetical protein [Salmonella enterica]
MLVFRHPQGEHFGAFLGQSGLLITPGRAGNLFPVGVALDKPQARQAFSGFRGAALNQSRSASGVYTGLLWWHECGYQESASCGRRDMWLGSVRNTMCGQMK